MLVTVTEVIDEGDSKESDSAIDAPVLLLPPARGRSSRGGARARGHARGSGRGRWREVAAAAGVDVAKFPIDLPSFVLRNLFAPGPGRRSLRACAKWTPLPKEEFQRYFSATMLQAMVVTTNAYAKAHGAGQARR